MVKKIIILTLLNRSGKQESYVLELREFVHGIKKTFVEFFKSHKAEDISIESLEIPTENLVSWMKSKLIR